MRHKVLCVGAFRFPNGDAAASRVLGVAKSLRVGGIDTCFISWGNEPSAPVSGIHDRFPFLILQEFRTRPMGPLSRTVRFFLQGSKTLKYLKAMDLSPVRAIIVYHGNSLFLLRLWRLCKAADVPLVVDCTEWYDSARMPGGVFGPAALDNWMRMRVVNPLVGKAIVISEFLADFYRRRGCDVVTVPPLIDVSEQPVSQPIWGPSENGKLRLVYAGSPGKKDRFEEVLEAIREVRLHGLDCTLDIYGPEEAEFFTLVGCTRERERRYRIFTNFHGRCQREHILDRLPAYDYSLVLRPDARYSQAGFPTKLVESFAAGLPPICSAVGDIPRFVTDGRNGFLVPKLDVSELVALFRRVAALDPNEAKKIRHRARQTAVGYFEFRRHTERLVQFLP